MSKYTEYEPVQIGKLITPSSLLDSEEQRENDSPSKKKNAIYRRRSPSESPSSEATSEWGYENMAALNKSLDTTSIVPLDADDTSIEFETELEVSESRRRCRPSGSTLEDFYLGAMGKLDAEKLVKKHTFFRLYHRIPSAAAVDLGALRDQISLYIVYKTSKGEYQ